MTKEQEETRQQMIAQGRDHLLMSIELASKWEAEEYRVLEDLADCHKALLLANEMRVTWIERLAAMMGVKVGRWMNGNTVHAVLADTDLDPVLDPDGQPVHIISDFDDLSKCVISMPKKEKTKK